MAARVTAPELEQFVVDNVLLTEVTLGAGAYGSVEEVEIPGARVAAKKLHPQLINLGSPEQVRKWVTDFVEECKLMSQLRHPHIVQFLGVAYLPGSQLPVLLMEKLQTSLDNLLETSPDIPLEVKVHLLTGTARGVVYLHSHTPPIAHRDLTARNILIDSGMIAKIADLGVARMVNIQPGQLAATMTRGPGNNLYMPPETVQDEGATRYNTSIDIFSFGVVSLFTLTQTFPKDLKPPNYFDSVTKRVLGRTEIERREDYVTQMKTAFGETHPLVKLTLDCLEYLPGDRPAAVEVLRRLEEVGRTVPQNCTETKLELIQQMARKDDVVARKEEEIGRNQIEHQRRQLEKDAIIASRDARIEQLQNTIDFLHTEKQEEARGIKEQNTLQQQQLEAQRREIGRLSRLLEKENSQPQESRPIALVKKVPSSITFNWRKRSDVPQSLKAHMHGQMPHVALNGKMYVKGKAIAIDRKHRRDILKFPVFMYTDIVMEYVPDLDTWTDRDQIPPPPVYCFTLATLKGQLLVVGGRKKVASVEDPWEAHKKTNAIFTLSQSETAREWVQVYPPMPAAVTYPTAIGYKDHLIVAGGWTANCTRTSGVNILDASTKTWIGVEPLPVEDDYLPVLIEDTLFLVGQDTKVVLRSQVPTLLSGGAWESITEVPYYRSSPVAIGNTLLTVGGSEQLADKDTTTTIQLYDHTKDQWVVVGERPQPMYNCHCVNVGGQLFVHGKRFNDSVIHSLHVSRPLLKY